MAPKRFSAAALGAAALRSGSGNCSKVRRYSRASLGKITTPASFVGDTGSKQLALLPELAEPHAERMIAQIDDDREMLGSRMMTQIERSGVYPGVVRRDLRVARPTTDRPSAARSSHR